MSEEDFSIFEYATDGGEWIITCLANETFRVTTSTQEAADALVDSFNRAFMIGMALETLWQRLQITWLHKSGRMTFLRVQLRL